MFHPIRRFLHKSGVSKTSSGKKLFQPRCWRPSVEALEDRVVPSGLVSDFVIFGDSLVDVGNLSDATGGFLPPPPADPQQPTYFEGRFSNGPLWVETLAEYLGEPAVEASRLGGLNYGYAGARIDKDVPFPSPFPYDQIPDVVDQVQLYLQEHAGETEATDLFAFLAGPNDFFFGDYTARIATGIPAEIGAALTDLSELATVELASAIQQLYVQGGRQFLVANLPPIGMTPFFLDQGDPQTIGLFNLLTDTYNAALSGTVAALKANLPGIQVTEIDIHALYNQALANPSAFGFTNVTNAVGPYNQLGHVTSIDVGVDPNEYLFFDSIHPSTKAHQAVGLTAAAEVYEALGVNKLIVTGAGAGVDPLDGQRTLREMLILANQMDGQQMIRFNLGHGPQQIELGGAALSITDDVDIRGLGAYRLGISGAGESRIFEVGAGVTANISHLTLRDGRAVQGGAIANEGDLTLRHVHFVNNVATSEDIAQGGAIYNTGQLGIYYSLFAHNQAIATAQAAGGAIANAGGGEVSINFSELLFNRAVSKDGNAFGGAIFSGAGSTLHLNHSLVAFNAAKSENGEAFGGGVYLAPDGVAHRKWSVILGNFASTDHDDVFGAFS